MNEVMKIVVLALTALVVATAATKPITGRSSRWDQMIHDHGVRHKRQAGRQWRTIAESCDDLGDLTRFDKLQRRNSGFLAPVGDQGQCGSCWAFAAAHAVSDTRNLAVGTQLDLLSAQYTARCASVNFGYGCCGDDPVNALEHYRHTGVATDVCLPYNYNQLSSKPPKDYTGNYKAENHLICFSECADGSAFDPSSIKIPNYKVLAAYTDETIIDALDSGQVVITLISPNEDFRQYGCGVLTTTAPPASNYTKLHAVTIVDYENDTALVNFWVLKNSWGIGRGESGYYRVRRGQGDLGLGIYPIFIPLLSPDSSVPSSDPTAETQETCALVDVTDPHNDVTTMSAVDFALQGLVDDQQVQCPNGAAATGLNLLSFDSAGVQVVAGTMVELSVGTSVGGCGATVTQHLSMTVFIDLDGTFTLTDYFLGTAITQPLGKRASSSEVDASVKSSFDDYNIGNTAKILTASMMLLFAMVMINLVINN